MSVLRDRRALGECRMTDPTARHTHAPATTTVMAGIAMLVAGLAMAALRGASPPMVAVLPESGDGEVARADSIVPSAPPAPRTVASSAPEMGDAAPHERRWFDARPIRPLRTVRFRVTAYSPDERSCGRSADGYTASGYSVWTNGMKLVAADTTILPFGSLVAIHGYDGGNVVPVLDRGGRIKGHRLDVLFPTHEEAMRWGVRDLDVTIWGYDDGASAELRRPHERRAIGLGSGGG
jgi:3D (Asp-Asp-Asp) domain-containing protein